MSHDPRRMTHVCERCRRVSASDELTHCKSVDEYLCEDCIMLLAIDHYESVQKDTDDADV
jgi:hypothetical protein